MVCAWVHQADSPSLTGLGQHNTIIQPSYSFEHHKCTILAIILLCNMLGELQMSAGKLEILSEKAFSKHAVYFKGILVSHSVWSSIFPK